LKEEEEREEENAYDENVLERIRERDRREGGENVYVELEIVKQEKDESDIVKKKSEYDEGVLEKVRERDRQDGNEGEYGELEVVHTILQ